MGLDDLDGMGIPDNKGGRPSKSGGTEKQKRQAEGDALTIQKDNEDWLRHKFNRFKGETDTIDECIEQLSAHIYINQITVRKKLEEYDIHETDWEEYIEKYSMYKKDGRLINRLLEAGVITESEVPSSEVSPGLSSMFGDSTTSSTDDDDDVSSGLDSLL